MRGGVAAVVLAGCYAPNPGVGGACSPSHACPGAQLCDLGRGICVDQLIDAGDGPSDTPTDPPTGHDEDGDGIADGTDLCPGIADPSQADADNDGVGDACDPNPGLGGDTLLRFEPFAGAVQSGWRYDSARWEVTGDALQGPLGGGTGEQFFATMVALSPVTVETAMTLESVSADGSAGAITNYDPVTGDHHRCKIENEMTQEVHAGLSRVAGDAVTQLESDLSTDPWQTGIDVDLRLTTKTEAADCLYRAAMFTGTLHGANNVLGAGGAGVRMRGLVVRIRYIAIYTR